MTRLLMLETVRQFALEEASDRADLENTRHRHCAWYLGFAEQCIGKLRTADEPPALDALDCDIDNIRSALGWVAADPAQAIKLAGLLGDYWSIHKDRDGLAWLDAALNAAGAGASAGDRARVHRMRASQLAMRWQWEPAIDAAALALELYREAGDDARMADAYEFLSAHRLRLGQYA
jgi:hypothetical protein